MRLCVSVRMCVCVCVSMFEGEIVSVCECVFECMCECVCVRVIVCVCNTIFKFLIGCYEIWCRYSPLMADPKTGQEVTTQWQVQC